MPEAVIGAVARGALHVMSYNLRYPAPDPEHPWEQRRDPMAELIAAESPCVLATQEGYRDQLQDLRSALGHYDWIGLGRDGGSHGEHTAVFVDRRRADVLGYDHLWLSDTPRTIASRTWGNELPRMLTWVRLTTGAGELVVVNTHLDHAHPQARVLGARMIAELVPTFAPVPVVVTGDFNVGADSAPYRELVPPLRDTWRAAAERATARYATFTGYAPARPDGDRIDWILATDTLECERAAINPCLNLARMPSDHLPVQAVLRPRSALDGRQ